MMRPYRWLCAIGTASVIAAGSVSAQVQGKTAPGFTLKTLNGGRDSLAHYSGRPVLINFWATWCGPCRSEMPLIIAAYQAHQGERLSVLAIDITDQERSTKDIRKFAAEFQLPFPVLLDERGKARRLYALRSLPTSVFVGRDGVVRTVNPGPISGPALREHLSEILADY